jgi:ssDNA-specific exonuclease RecJ
MSFIKEQDNGINITRYYKISQINSNLEAIDWISSIRHISGMATDYIYYSDLMNRSDEGSGNIQLDPKVNIDTMRSKFQERDVDLISIIGEFDEKPVVIGYSSQDKNVYITIRKKIPADINMLEKELNLI